MSNTGQINIKLILQTNNLPRRLQIHRYVEFSQNVGWKLVAMISLKMRKLGFEMFFESDFSNGNHCFKSQEAQSRILWGLALTEPIYAVLFS